MLLQAGRQLIACAVFVILLMYFYAYVQMRWVLPTYHCGRLGLSPVSIRASHTHACSCPFHAPIPIPRARNPSTPTAPSPSTTLASTLSTLRMASRWVLRFLHRRYAHDQPAYELDWLDGSASCGVAPSPCVFPPATLTPMPCPAAEPLRHHVRVLLLLTEQGPAPRAHHEQHERGIVQSPPT